MTGALALAAPLAAHAGPLLSGYGGPGQGNQAILGSTLIGGSGGSGGSGGGPATTASAPGLAATSASSPAQAGAAPGHANASSGSSRRGTHSAPGAGKAATRAAQATGGELGERSYHGPESVGGSSALGLSAVEIVYIVVAAAALAFTGLLTRRLAGARTAKGHS